MERLAITLAGPISFCAFLAIDLFFFQVYLSLSPIFLFTFTWIICSLNFSEAGL